MDEQPEGSKAEGEHSARGEPHEEQEYVQGDSEDDHGRLDTPHSKELSQSAEQGSEGDLDAIVKFPNPAMMEEEQDEIAEDLPSQAIDDEFDELDSQMAEVYTDFLKNRAVAEFDKEFKAAMSINIGKLDGITEVPDERETPRTSYRISGNQLWRSKPKNAKQGSRPGNFLTRKLPDKKDKTLERIKIVSKAKVDSGDIEHLNSGNPFLKLKANTYSVEEHKYLERKQKRNEKLANEFASKTRYPELFSEPFDYQKVLHDSAEDLEMMQQQVNERLRQLREERASRERVQYLTRVADNPSSGNLSSKRMPSTVGIPPQPRRFSPKPLGLSEPVLSRKAIPVKSTARQNNSVVERISVDPQQKEWVHQLMAEQREREERKRRREMRRMQEEQEQRDKELEAQRQKEELAKKIRLAKVENRLHEMQQKREWNREATQVQNRVVRELLQRPRMFYYFKASSEAVERVKATLKGKRSPTTNQQTGGDPSAEYLFSPGH